jgi:MFS transporter, UMF1 family
LLAGFGADANTFWVAAFVAGLCMGSSQSVGRAMVGTLAPQDRLGEFFGLWALATRLSAIIGPLTYGLVTWATAGNHRLAILMTGLFFVVGLIVLKGIEMPKPATNRT